MDKGNNHRSLERKHLRLVSGDDEPVTYYDKPALKPAPFDRYVSGYIFLAGLAGASQIIATMADWFGGREEKGIVRNGRYIAALGALTGPLLLIADLKTPSRWYNMMRIFRRTSPMSIGSWILTTFGLSSAFSAFGQFNSDRRRTDDGSRLARMAQLPAALSGAGMTSYTASLLAATSAPYWASAPRALAGSFASASVATGSAALSLIERFSGRVDAAEKLEKLAFCATISELLFAAIGRQVRQTNGIEADHDQAALESELTGALVGQAVPIACYVGNALARRPAPALSVLGAASILIGGLMMRNAVMEAGKKSSLRPQDDFRLNRGRP